jgi:type IV pilus assembly protein PilY1
MHKTTQPAPFVRQVLAVILANLMAFSPMVQAITPVPPLADTPLTQVNPVPANVVFTLDDSGSMGQHNLPDYTDDAMCNDAWDASQSGTDGNIDLDSCAHGASVNGEIVLTGSVPMFSAAFNRSYYNPNVTYLPGRQSNGTELPQQTAANTTNWTAVRSNIYQNASTSNLTQYPEVLWCVTDNPDVDINNPRLCRRNGVAYPDTAVFNPATYVYIDQTKSVGAVTAGYNYPNGSQSALGASGAARFMFRTSALWCTINNPNAAQRLDPLVCRRNGVTYPAAGAGRPAVNANTFPLYYPNNNRILSPGNEVRYTNRIEIGTYRIFGNPYYYNSTVVFCQNRETSNSSVSKGYGTTNCSPRWDQSVYRYPKFTTFTRVNIDPASGTYTAPNGVVRSAAEEMTNFANWFAFARFRMLGAKTAASIAFSALPEEKFSVGFHVLNNVAARWLTIAPFTAAHKTSWFSTMYATNPGGGTPSIDAHYRVGEYFRTGELPLVRTGGTLTGTVVSTDPLADTRFNACQFNYHILSTDGYWNQGDFSIADSPVTIANTEDRTVTNDMPFNWASKGIIRNTAWPRPYAEGVATTRVSLSDVATYYWARDLRGGIANRTPVAAAGDPNWQRLTMYGLALGAEGNLPYPGGLGAVAAGSANWGQPSSLTPDAIDDMWHGANNTEGQYLNAQTPEELATALVGILTNIANRPGTNAAQSLAKPTLNATDNRFTYLTGFAPSWAGTLNRIELDPTTAQPVPGSLLNWSFGTRLDTQSGPYLDSAMVTQQGWDRKRRIFTRNPANTAAVPFRIASIGTHANSLGTTVAQRQRVLDFLRGDRSNEGNAFGQLRVRASVLGDLVDSEAVRVAPPNRSYKNATDPGYETFLASNSMRRTMVFAGSNGGMLHAVDDTTGTEQWAYVPSMLFRNDATGLIGLSYQQGGIPGFNHRYYVNATPRVQDVDFARVANAAGTLPVVPTSTSDWRTLLVGGLGKGGRGYYALDITNPGGIYMDPSTPSTLAAAATESAVATQVSAWEFTDGGGVDMGFTYGRPIIAKTYAYGWVAIVNNGYNAPSGKGVLYILNAKTGALLKKMTVPGGSATNPINLAPPAGYTITFTNQLIEQVYAGDMNGDVWRFDLADPNPNNWTIAKIAELRDAGGAPQPVTASAQIEINPSEDKFRYVFIGTGKLLHPNDYTSTQVQSFYAIRDGNKSTPKAYKTAVPVGTVGADPIVRADLRQVTDATGVPAVPPTEDTFIGWYRDLPTDVATGPRRMVKPPIADIGVVSFSAQRPSPDFCSPGFDDIIYGTDYYTGRSVLPAVGGGLADGYAQVSGTAGLQFIQTTTASGAIGDVFIRVTDLTGQTTLIKPNVAGRAAGNNRMTWRIVE